MNAHMKKLFERCFLLGAIAMAFGSNQLVDAQVVAPSTWGSGIVIDPQPRNPDGTPILPPSAAAFDDWDSVPLAVADPADNPSALNIIDIADVKIANDANMLYIYASGHKLRTNGLYLAFDTDQNIATGFDIYGLGLVGSELGYVNDYVFDQRTPGVFNANVADACCTGGPLDVNNGGALLYPGWDVEFGEREWGVPLDALWSVNAPFGPTFPNATFNFILWTDQALTDVTDTITYTLALPPAGGPGDYNSDTFVDAADYTIWRDTLGSTSDLRANGDNAGASAGVVDLADYEFWKLQFGGAGSGGYSTAAVPEPAIASMFIVVAAALAMSRGRRASG